jgi:hypothetical protein
VSEYVLEKCSGAIVEEMVLDSIVMPGCLYVGVRATAMVNDGGKRCVGSS